MERLPCELKYIKITFNDLLSGWCGALVDIIKFNGRINVLHVMKFITTFPKES
jgi:hypothetical protein